MPTRLVVLAADASLAGVAMVWGATFPLGKLVLRHLGPFQYLALRFAAAAALMVPLAWRERGRLRPAGVRAGVLAGVLLFAGAALQTVGLQYTTAGNAGLITGLNVLIIPLILLVWQRRLPTGALAAGVGLAAAGLGLLLWQGERIGGGDALVLGCAFALALQTIVVGRVASSVPAAPFACVQVAVVALLAAGPGFGLEPRPAAVPAGAIAAILFMALTATLGPYIAQAWAQRLAAPPRPGGRGGAGGGRGGGGGGGGVGGRGAGERVGRRGRPGARAGEPGRRRGEPPPRRGGGARRAPGGRRGRPGADLRGRGRAPPGPGC